MTLQIEVKLKGGVRPDDAAGAFISFCPALGLYSQGVTEDEAAEALKSAVGLYLLACYERGQIDRALREAGFDRATASGLAAPQSYADEWIAIREATPSYREAFEFSVPLHLIAAQQAECRP